MEYKSNRNTIFSPNHSALIGSNSARKAIERRSPHGILLSPAVSSGLWYMGDAVWTGLSPTPNVLPKGWKRKAYSWERANKALIVCSSTKWMDGDDLINSDTAGY